MTAPPGRQEAKAEWRAWARSVRSGLDWAAVSERIAAAIRAWGGLEPGATVVLFDPLPDEPDLLGLADGVTALLTRTPPEGVLTLHHLDGPMERHRLGFSQPAADSPEVSPADVDAVLVPGLAFDRSGVRLGRGAGHFDRLLPLMKPGTLLVGIAPEACVVDALPADGHDVPMSHLATEGGVMAVAGRVRAMADAQLTSAARAWIEGDPDPVTRAELEAVLASGDDGALRERMGSTLRFGTAGIRGVVAAGSNRMNRATVIRATRGVADHLLAAGRGDGPVVVGRDARTSSEQFMNDTVAVLAAAGIPVRFFPDVAPTPLVAYAARRLDAAAAVVVTASHNPQADNGYKVYDANAAQIVPPTDAEIAAAIDKVGPAAGVPRLEGAMLGSGGLARPVAPGLVDEYVAEVVAALPARSGDRGIAVVYTPLHGVGRDSFLRAMGAAGFSDVRVVAEQAEPDGRFPTVAFPNPEEPGALDLALGLAEECGADLVLANDPDADRLAACVPDGAGGWRALSGNQIGILLADHVLRHDPGGARPLVVNSIVSSPMLASVAAAHGAAFTQTLTGFKWICNAALDLARDEGLRFVFGYEEALGYSVGPVVRDKDGIGAGVWFADLAARLQAGGSTVLARLAELAALHGLWVSTQLSIVRPGAAGAEQIDRAMGELRTRRPETLGGFEVTGTTDFRDGAGDRPRWLPAQALVAFELGAAGRALVRPSGTEPKLKIYVDRRTDLGGDGLAAAESAARAEADAVAADLARFLGFD